MSMPEVDYGYGDAAPDTDYGYGDGAPDNTDYGYGDSQPDYGYGETQTDYGYGDAQPDYGYGDQGNAADQYGYGDMGYGDAAPAPPSAETKRPKRRCSVTKYSLQSAPGCGASEAAPEAAPAPEDDKSSANTAATAVSVESTPEDHQKRMAKQEKVVKKGMMSKVRKRLSIFN